jgi:hypothetical protein
VVLFPCVFTEVLEIGVGGTVKLLEIWVGWSIKLLEVFPGLVVLAESVGGSEFWGVAVVLLPGIFSSVNLWCLSSWAEFLGFSGIVSEAPVFKMHNLNVRSIKILEIGVGGSIELLEVWVGWSIKLLESCWLWVLAVSIFGFTFSGGAVSSPWVSGFLIIVVDWGGWCGGSGDWGSSGSDWGGGGSLGWNLPDSEFDFTFNWDGDFLVIVELGISDHGAFSSGTGSGESLVNLAIWDGELEAESGFDPVNWSGVSGGEVLEVWVWW